MCGATAIGACTYGSQSGNPFEGDSNNVVIWDPTVTPPTTGPQFYEGFKKSMELGDSIRLDEYIIYPEEESYSITLTKQESDFEMDLTSLSVYSPLEPGVYVLTYSIETGEYAGSNSIEIEVKYPKIDIEYTRLNDLILEYGVTLTEEEFLNLLDLDVSYAYGYDLNWSRVSYTHTDGTTKAIDLSETSSYTIAAVSTHNFFFVITSEDGQRYEMNQLIQVKYTNEETLAWLESKDISVEGYISLNDDKSVVLGAGTSQPGYGDDYVPYLAYEGDYGTGT